METHPTGDGSTVVNPKRRGKWRTTVSVRALEQTTQRGEDNVLCFFQLRLQH